MSADNCPISTAGLRALVALLEEHDPENIQAARKAERQAQAEKQLIADRLTAAFGECQATVEDTFILEMAG